MRSQTVDPASHEVWLAVCMEGAHSGPKVSRAEWSMQTTIQRTVGASGVGLHTACRVSVQLRPAPEDTGIVFRRTDLHGFAIEASRKHVSRVALATTLIKQGVMLSTVEHLLSGVCGSRIDNLYLDVDSLELPIMDG